MQILPQIQQEPSIFESTMAGVSTAASPTPALPEGVSVAENSGIDHDDIPSSLQTSPRQPPPSAPGQLKTIACDLCRRRKSFCTKTTPKCDRCKQKNLKCVYKPAKKITVTEDFIRDLQNRVRHLELEQKVRAHEHALGLTKPPAPAPKRSPEQHNQCKPTDDEEIEAASLLMGRLNVNGSGSYQGAAAADHLLRSLGQLAGIEPDEDDILNAPAARKRTFYDTDLLPSRRMMGTGYVDLPPIEVARENFRAQYEYIGTIFSFCPPAEFEELLEHGYALQCRASTLDMGSGLAFAKLLVLLAFGQLYSINKWVGRNGPPGFDLFTAATQYLPELHEDGSILFVETLALIGYFMQNLNRRDAALLYVGLASRMAISLGLHEEAGTTMRHVDEPTRERRRRVWWSVYSLDCILSAKSGTPLSIAGGDMGVSLPSRLPSEPSYCPAVVLRHYTMLSRILSDISRNIYRKARKPGAKLVVADVHGIMQQLDRWYGQLPKQLRFEPARQGSREGRGGVVSRESVSTMLHYYMCLNMTARPLFFHVVQRRLKKCGKAAAAPGGNAKDEHEDWKVGLSAPTVSVIEMCVDGARKTVEMMTVAAKVNLVATYGYMDSEHAFAAAIVLVMVCLAFPREEGNMKSMNAALALLRFMANRGNSHIADRLSLLERVRARVTGTDGDEDMASGEIGGGDSVSVLRPAGMRSPALKEKKPVPERAAQEVWAMERQDMMGDWDFNSMADLFTGQWMSTTGASQVPTTTFDSSQPETSTLDDHWLGTGSQSWAGSTPFNPVSDPALGNVLDATAPNGWDFLSGELDAGLWENSFANPRLNMDMDSDLTMLADNVGGGSQG
ncbi:Proline utilization trans-activator [Zalerion maritima]|uniref:Proline utilization trans-activator n=1 Tax=Zalerion maritima TaxID=339359 RepID=A0AAD5RSE0_9PEZI|nr:Proline utilization trans-activator [Zalerion maritima]